MTLRMHNILVIIIAFSALRADLVPAEQASPPIAAQKHIGDQACGPCSVVNALNWGAPQLKFVLRKIRGENLDEKVRTLIAAYGTKPSEAYKAKHARYHARGMAPTDMLFFFNDVLRDHSLPPLSGTYLDKKNTEGLPAHLRRVHAVYKKSLSESVPVITSFGSFAASSDETGKKYFWKSLLGHYVTVIDVQDTIRDNEKGFSFTFLDPQSGKLEYGYIYFDETRNFTAARGNEEEFEWRTDRPFLLVAAPSLRMKTQNTEQPWYVRTIITLNYAIYFEG